MKTKFLIATACGALLISSPAMAQVQDDQGGILGRLLGSVFGNNQQTSEETLESDWDQQRRPFEERRATLEARIDAAVRDGSITRSEADDMRREYNDIVRLEAQYSADGNISQQQRSDLRSRYRALSQRVGGRGYGQGNGYGNNNGNYQDQGEWQPLSMRTSDFQQRVATGLRNRTLTRAEAMRLRTDWRALAQVEANYQRGGLDSREEADLWTRYNAIDMRLGGSVSGGYGNDRNTARWTQMETRLATAEQANRITRTDAAHIRSQLSDLARLDMAYGTNGYTADERAYLTQRYSDLDQMLGYYRR